MPSIPTQKVSIILERVPLESRWATHRWDLVGVVPDQGGEPRTIVDTDELVRKVYPGFEPRPLSRRGRRLLPQCLDRTRRASS
jgi:hypothetical protein